MIEFMRPRTKYIGPDVVAQILRKMIADGWTDDEMARFLELWRQSHRAMTIFAWLSRPEDDLDRKLDEFLREFLLVE